MKLKENNNIQSQGLTDPLKQNEDQNKKIEQQVPNKVIKDKINKEYIFKETKIENNRVTEYMQNIEEKNYGNNNRKIYIIPSKEIILSKKNNAIYFKNILSSSEINKICKKFIKVFTKYKGKEKK